MIVGWRSDRKVRAFFIDIYQCKHGSQSTRKLLTGCKRVVSLLHNHSPNIYHNDHTNYPQFLLPRTGSYYQP